MNFDDIQHPRDQSADRHAGGRPDRRSRSSTTRSWSPARNNLVYLEQFPVFYWPVHGHRPGTAELLRRRRPRHQDRIFGTQIMTDINAYQLFGIRNRPAGTKWDISADYLSKRGFGARHHVQLPAADAVRRAGQHQRLLRLLGHSRPAASTTSAICAATSSGKYLRPGAAEFPRPLPGPASTAACPTTSS